MGGVQTRLTRAGVITLLIGIALLAIAELGLANFVIPNQQIAWELLVDIGTAVAVAGLVIIFVERLTSAHLDSQLAQATRHLDQELKGFIDQLRADLVQAMFGHRAHHQLSTEITQHILLDSIRYRKFEVSNNLQEILGATDALEGDSTARFEVVNASDAPVSWEYHMWMSDLPSGQTPTPNAVTDFEATSATNPQKDVHLSQGALAATVVGNARLGRIELRQTFTLDPEEVLCVRTVRHIRVRARDDHSLTVRHPTIDGLRLEVELPPGFKADCTFAHPGHDDPNQCGFGVVGGIGQRIVARASIRRGILPYQGITVSWVRE